MTQLDAAASLQFHVLHNRGVLNTQCSVVYRVPHCASPLLPPSSTTTPDPDPSTPREKIGKKIQCNLHDAPRPWPPAKTRPLTPPFLTPWPEAYSSDDMICKFFNFFLTTGFSPSALGDELCNQVKPIRPRSMHRSLQVSLSYQL